jgi:hypothetical protein
MEVIKIYVRDVEEKKREKLLKAGLKEDYELAVVEIIG